MAPVPPPLLLPAGHDVGDVAAGSASYSFFRKRWPLITYGKKDTRPLPLTASHFRRYGDQYEDPANNDEDDRGTDQNGLLAKGSAATAVVEKAVTDDEDSESGLSDEPSPDPEDEIDRCPSSPRERGAETNAARRTAFSKACLGRAGKRALAETPSHKRVSPRQIPPAPKRAKRDSTTEPTRHNPERPSRRLPVNELVLVASPVDPTSTDQSPVYVSSHRGNDPVSGQAASIHNGTVSQVGSGDELRNHRWFKQRPVSAFKERLRGNRRRHKSVSDLREKRTERSRPYSTKSNDHGDGFADGELFVSPHARRPIRKRQPRHDQLIPGFGALQLRAGSLPDVVFDAAPASLKVEVIPASSEHDGVKTPDKFTRRVSFGEQRQEAIIAQLASVSAPPLPRPMSGGSNDGESQHSGDDDEDEEDDDEDASMEQREGSADTGLDENQIAEGFQAMAENDIHEAETEATEVLETLPIALNEVNHRGCDEELTSGGVSLDFRRHIPGHRPRRRIRQDPLIEVHEAIHEVVGNDDVPAGPSQLAPVGSRSRQQSFGSGYETTQTARFMHNRPRSILKNATQAVPEATTQPEHTAANTRRNSTVELSESRYFTDAADMMLNVDPTKHKIVPRRRSSYFYQETSDGSSTTPEATPALDAEMLDYAATSDLEVLRRSSEAEWTSQSLPTASRDLGSLTRSVSGAFGTLSQSVRRRPSLPFQSPTKMR